MGSSGGLACWVPVTFHRHHVHQVLNGSPGRKYADEVANVVIK